MTGKTTTQRGYGHRHQQVRARVKRDVQAGTATCWRCMKHIRPDEPWDLGHDDNDRSLYKGPEHRACNRAVNSHRTPTDAADTSRPW